MKSSSMATRLVTVLVALGIFTYFGILIYRYYSDPLTTAVAYEYQGEEALTVTGYMIRNEEILTGGTSGIPDLFRTEGERVGAGQKLAVIYQNQEAMTRQQEVEGLETRLEQLQYVREAAANSEASLKMDSSIASHIRALHAALSADKLAAAETHIAELRTLVSKRDYTYRDSDDLTGRITEVTAQLKSAKAASGGGVSVVRAQKSGIYSAEVDGFEAVLTPAGIAGLTPSLFNALQPDGAVSQLGKLIYGDEWYFAVVLPVAEAKAFRVGEETLLRFAKGQERTLSVEIHALSAEEDGQQVVVFSGKKYLSQLTLMRKQSVDIIANSYTGLRVPKNALRVITTTVEDEDGVTREVKTTGVYCMVGVSAQFKPVEVLYTGEGFCLLAAASQDDKSRLRAGDQVSISAEDLYDGKVVG